jgi:antirestriction protein ArdC
MTRRNESGRRRAPIPRDHYQDVTDEIVAALEAGTLPWQRPWNPDNAGGPSMPFNGATGRRYRGINVLLLGMSPLAFASGDPRWCTYRQAAEKDWQVRRGERGTTVFFYKQLVIEDGRPLEDADERTKRIPILRAFTVFNGSQVDGIPPYAPPTVTEAPWRRPEATDIILRNSGADIRIGGERAFFSPATDHIQLPPESAFSSGEAWSAVACHELAHWTGHVSRLNRDLSGRFGSQDYSREELRAELSSLYIGTALGIPTDISNHASYIESWIAILKNDRREIFRAAADAQRIADYCLGFHPDYSGGALADFDIEEPHDHLAVAA